MTNPSWYQSLAPRRSAGELGDEFWRDLEQFGGQKQDFEIKPSGFAAPNEPAQPQQVLQMDDSSLIARAKFFGIPEEVARQMPHNSLVAAVVQAEEHLRGTQVDLPGWMEQLRKFNVAGFDEAMAGFALGSAQGAIGMFKNLPFVGEKIAKIEAVQKADEWLNNLEQGVRLLTPAQDQMSISGGQVTGHIAALWYPAAGAWNLAGKAGKFVPWAGKITSPILRQAAQGGASAWMLEGRGLDQTAWRVANGTGSEEDAQQLQRAVMVTGLGAGLGAAIPAIIQYAPQMKAAVGRVSEAFGYRQNRGVAGDAPLGPWQEVAERDPRLAQMADLDQLMNDPAAPMEAKETARVLLEELRGRPAGPPPPPPAGGSPTAYLDEAEALAAEPTFIRRVAYRGEKPGVASDPSRPRFFSADPEQAAAYGSSVVEEPIAFRNPLIAPHMPEAFEMLGVKPPALNSEYGKTLADAAKAQGYDGVVLYSHLGEKAENYIKFSVDAADAQATQMTKQSLLAESSSLPQVTSQSLPNEITVAQAVTIDNPGGVNVIPGIPDPINFARLIAPSQHVRFATRPGSKALDAIISDQPITDEMVGDFERTGFFVGQRAITSSGNEGLITTITGDVAFIKPVYGGQVRHVQVSSLMPSPTSPGTMEAGQYWSAFKSFAQEQAVAANEAVGGVMTPERVEQMARENLPTYLSKFLDQRGIMNPGERARITMFFDDQLVQESRQLAPVEIAQADEIGQMAAAAEMMNPLSTEARVEAKALSKGFIAIPDGKGSYKMLDINQFGSKDFLPKGSVEIPGDAEAAEAWLNRLHRELPDISPSSTVPGEIAESLPTASPRDPRTPHADDLMTLQVENAQGMADELIEAGDDFGVRLRADIEAAAATGDLAKVQAAWEYGAAQMQPMRARFLEIDRKLSSLVQETSGGGVFGASFGDIKPFQMYDNVSHAQVNYHNNAYPWLSRWAGIMVKFKRQDVRNGVVTQLWELNDPALRRAAAEKAKFTPEQIGALDEMEAFIDELGGKDAARNVAGYLAKLRVRQSLPLNQREQFAMGDVHPVAKPFADYAEGSSLQLRELDASVMGNVLVRSQMFQQHLAPKWNPAMEMANALKGVEGMENLGQFMDRWLKIVKFGYNPVEDQALTFMHTVASTLIPGMTKAQVRNLFGTGMSLTHRALLGFRPDVWARDSMQLLLALPRVGDDLLGAMKTYASASAAEREAITQRALDGGWVVRGQPRVASPGLFEDPVVYLAEGELPVSQRSTSRRYKALQSGVDAVYNATPQALRHPEGTWLDPLYVYSKQSEKMRLLPGYAMATRADREIARFRSLGATGDLDDLVVRSRASTFDQSIQQVFKDYVAAGDDRGAADFLARQVADATQFKYGLSENPELARTMGGRMFMQMGNFSTQFYQFMRESLRNGASAAAHQKAYALDSGIPGYDRLIGSGTTKLLGSGLAEKPGLNLLGSPDKVRFLAMMGGTMAAFKLAKAVTGWDFDKWQYYHSLTFTGGPWVTALADMLSGVNSAGQMVWQEGGNQTGTGRYQEERAGRVGGAAADMVNMINPLAGGMRTLGGAAQALESPNPANAFGRLLVTGERGNAPDYRNLFEETFSRPPAPLPTPEQMQPMQGPVRGSGFGIPVPQPDSTQQSYSSQPPGQVTQASSGPALPPDSGVSDTSKVYTKGDYLVYDSPNRSADGKVPTHRLGVPSGRQPRETWEAYEARVLSTPIDSAPLEETSLAALEPSARMKMQQLIDLASRSGIALIPQETTRSQRRQEYLFQQGRSRPGTVVTWTLTSNHSTGEAVDFAPTPGAHNWLEENAARLGLVRVPGDPGHVAAPKNSTQPATLGAGAGAGPGGGGGAFF